MLLEEPASDLHAAGSRARRLYTIRAADSEGHRSSAHILVNRMYGWRGYRASDSFEAHNPRLITLVAGDHDATVGTMTVAFDWSGGLSVEETFPLEVEEMRCLGVQLCEFTKLAIDGVVRSKRVLASLFHMSFIHAERMGDCDTILVEVNPRHVRYYTQMLGFDTKSQARINSRVKAPSVLLSLQLSHARNQINRFGGRPDLCSRERSLYPYFFSAEEEAAIGHRVRV